MHPLTQLEGVGAGALEAALKAVDMDVEALVARAGCSPGQPVPYALLADTLEEIAENSKRLVITATLVRRGGAQGLGCRAQARACLLQGWSHCQHSS